METHLIELEEDFLGLQEYIKENNYKHLTPSCKAYSILQDKNYASAIEFAFDDHETFVVSLPKRELQENACKWVASFIPKKEDNTDLIFGKDRTERIVGCEVENNQIELFIEKEDGNIESKFMFNEYWILSCIKHDSTWQKLQGQQYYRFIKKYTDRNEFEEDRKRLKKYKVYSIYDPKEAAMVLNGFTYFKGMQVSDVSVLSFDIESIGLVHDNNAKVLLISNTLRKAGKTIKRLFAFDEFGNQGEMLTAWCDWVREVNPSIIMGYNIFNFDLPYMQHVADLEGISLNLGRDGSALYFNDWESKHRKGNAQIEMYKKGYIYGREIVDLYFLVWKYYNSGRRYDNYKLKNIIKEEYDAAIEKLESGETISEAQQRLVDGQKNRQFYDADKIRFNYTNPIEWEKIKNYCIHDADDSLYLYDLFMPAYFYYNQSIPKSCQELICTATGSQINSLMVRSYLQNYHSIARDTETTNYEGGISLGNPGRYKNVFKVDVSSLYPSTILQYEIHDKFKDPNQHFLKMVSYFTTKRLEYKKLGKKDSYYKDLSEAFKICINSAYGFMGAPGLNYNSPKCAELVTRYGREVLQTALKWAEDNKFGIVNADTDSISITNNGEELTEEDRKNILDSLNSLYPEKIRMDDDGYYSDVIIVRAKNYILKKKDAKKPKIKGSGLQASTKPKALQKYIKEFIDLLLEGKTDDELVGLYHKYVKEILNIQDITPWCSKKSISSKVLKTERTTEKKIYEAIEDLEDKNEGVKVFLYFRPDKSLSLGDKWDKDNPDHDAFKLIQMLWDTTGVFDSIIDIKKFEKYHLKGKRKNLDMLM